MRCPGNSEFRSADRRFGLEIGSSQLERLYTLCDSAHPLETGGLLVGRYNAKQDTAIVTCISAPPPDSHSERRQFYRGTHGLNALLARLWPQQKYYLGEWHYHPDGSALPSDADTRQMLEVAAEADAHCPEPVLLVVGVGRIITAHVFPRCEAPVRLNPITATQVWGYWK